MNKRFVQAIFLLIGIVIGFTISELASPARSNTETSTITSSVTTTMTTTSMMASTATTTQTEYTTIPNEGDFINASVNYACAYLAADYNSSVGLISETPKMSGYFLYSDNYLAMLVLSKFCNNQALYKRINETLSNPTYDPSKLPNQYMVFECKWYFDSAHDTPVNGSIWSTVNNISGPPLSPIDYSDIAFLQSYYSLKCEHNRNLALANFTLAAQMFNGVGFNDTPFQRGNSSGTYQTYKLALYIFLAGLLNQTVPLSAYHDLISMQNITNGGFQTGYYQNLSYVGTFTNAETTCLAIMALEENVLVR